LQVTWGEVFFTAFTENLVRFFHGSKMKSEIGKSAGSGQAVQGSYAYCLSVLFKEPRSNTICLAKNIFARLW
jgi:hypothetical protein